jgi:hypothetical protein
MARDKTKFEIKIDSAKIQKLVRELSKLGEPKWVQGRYKAATKKALQPALAEVIRTAPVDKGMLKASLTINARNSKKKKGRTDARVGINAKKFFVRMINGKLQLYQPGKVINAIEFAKDGKAGAGFVRAAISKTAKPKHILPVVERFMTNSIRKRSAFLIKKGRKK